MGLQTLARGKLLPTFLTLKLIFLHINVFIPFILYIYAISVLCVVIDFVFLKALISVTIFVVNVIVQMNVSFSSY